MMMTMMMMYHGRERNPEGERGGGRESQQSTWHSVSLRNDDDDDDDDDDLSIPEGASPRCTPRARKRWSAVDPLKKRECDRAGKHGGLRGQSLWAALRALSRVDRLLLLRRRGGERLGHPQQVGRSKAQSVSAFAGVLALFHVDLLLLVLYEEVILTRFGFSSNAIFDKQLLLELLPVNYGNASGPRTCQNKLFVYF